MKSPATCHQDYCYIKATMVFHLISLQEILSSVWACKAHLYVILTVYSHLILSVAEKNLCSILSDSSSWTFTPNLYPFVKIRAQLSDTFVRWCTFQCYDVCKWDGTNSWAPFNTNLSSCWLQVKGSTSSKRVEATQVTAVDVEGRKKWQISYAWKRVPPVMRETLYRPVDSQSRDTEDWKTTWPDMTTTLSPFYWIIITSAATVTRQYLSKRGPGTDDPLLNQHDTCQFD